MEICLIRIHCILLLRVVAGEKFMVSFKCSSLQFYMTSIDCVISNMKINVIAYNRNVAILSCHESQDDKLTFDIWTRYGETQQDWKWSKAYTFSPVQRRFGYIGFINDSIVLSEIEEGFETGKGSTEQLSLV